MSHQVQHSLPTQIPIVCNAVISICPVYAAPHMLPLSVSAQLLQALIDPAMQTAMVALPKDIPLMLSSATEIPIGPPWIISPDRYTTVLMAAPSISGPTYH